MVASKREIQLIMQRFDHNKDGKLRFSDFCDIITPLSPPNYVARIIQNKFHFVPKETVMAEETKHGLKEVLT